MGIDLGAVELDGAQPGAGRDALRRGVDEVEPADAEGLDGAGHLAGDGFGGADVEGAVLDLGIEFLPAQRRPAAQRADAVR